MRRYFSYPQKQFHTLTFKFLFSYLKNFFHTKISYLVKTFFVSCCAFISYQAQVFRTLIMVFHTKWPSFHTPNNQFRCGRCRRARDLREQESHVRSGQSTALCPTTHPVEYIDPPPRACRNMGSNAGPGRRRALCGCRRNPWVAARPTPATGCRVWSQGRRAGHSVWTRSGCCSCTECGSARGHYD